jgi:hypothetical protein
MLANTAQAPSTQSAAQDAGRHGSSPQYPTMLLFLGKQLDFAEVSNAEMTCRMEDLSGFEIGCNFNHSLRSFDMSRFMSKDRSDDG